MIGRYEGHRTDAQATCLTYPAATCRLAGAIGVDTEFESTFGADTVARLLDEPLGAVLERLQGAADAGTPPADHKIRQGQPPICRPPVIPGLPPNSTSQPDVKWRRTEMLTALTAW